MENKQFNAVCGLYAMNPPITKEILEDETVRITIKHPISKTSTYFNIFPHLACRLSHKDIEEIYEVIKKSYQSGFSDAAYKLMNDDTKK